MPSTHWSLIFAAAGTGREAREALAKFYQTYHGAVHRFVSRRTSNPSDAQEFTQQFFADLIAHRDMAKLDPALGSFHAWLYRCLRNALLNFYRYKRHRITLVSQDAVDCAGYPDPNACPEQEFVRQCALAVYLEARSTTRREYPHIPAEVFDVAVPAPGAASMDQATLAAQLGVSAAAFRTRVKDARIKFRAVLYRQLASRTPPSTVADEARALCEAISEIPCTEERHRGRIRVD